MVVTAASIVVLYSSLPTDLPNDIWAPSAPVLPFALLVIVGWSIACGDVFLLPLAVVLVSFTSQCHLAYLLPGVAILAVAGAGLLFCMRVTDAPPPAVASRYPVSRWVLLAAVAALVCWSFPVLDQGLGWAGKPGHGNLVHIANTAGAGGDTAGIGAGMHQELRPVVGQ